VILINGEVIASIPADDRGLAYGDGLFETLRARKGRLPLLHHHLDRLYLGLQVLQFPGIPRETLCQELNAAARANPDGVVKLIVTRGSGGRGYAPPSEATVRRIIQVLPAPSHVDAWNERGIGVRFCTTRLEGLRALDGLKHLNRLAQVLARAEWNDPEIHEGLMRDHAGNVVEGTMSNLFVVCDGLLITPPVGAGVCGVMRRFVLECAVTLGIETSERFVIDEEIMSAGEIFLTNSVIGICPVVRIGNLQYQIGTMTRRLQSVVETELERLACSAD